MFHMSREIYDKIEELACLIANGPEFQAVKQARQAARAEPRLTDLQKAYATLRHRLDEATDAEQKDFDLLAALTRELEDATEQMRLIPAYNRLEQAQTEYEQLMQGMDDVLRSLVDPDVQCSCRSSCASCEGCSACNGGAEADNA